MKRYLGLDVGDRTIGVAVSDLLGLTAQGVETIRRRTTEEDFQRIGELMREYDANSLVIGWPKNMNGTEGERCRLVKAFGEELGKAYPESEIIFQDERLSTMAADKALIRADVSRKKRRKVIDKMAAVFILQGFMDGNR